MDLSRFKKGACITMLSVVCSIGHAGWNRSTDHLRVLLSTGPRYINNEVINTASWDIDREIGFAVYRDDPNKNIYYGLEFLSNNSWNSRINQTSQSSQRFLQTVSIHNSSSLNLLASAGKHWGDWNAGISAGAQLAWVKWMNTVLAIDNKLKVVPKVRVSLNYNISKKSSLFVAFNQSFNVYGSPHCDIPNCLNDNGYVSVSDLKLGVSFVLQ